MQNMNRSNSKITPLQVVRLSAAISVLLLVFILWAYFSPFVSENLLPFWKDKLIDVLVLIPSVGAAKRTKLPIKFGAHSLLACGFGRRAKLLEWFMTRSTGIRLIPNLAWLICFGCLGICSSGFHFTIKSGWSTAREPTMSASCIWGGLRLRCWLPPA